MNNRNNNKNDDTFDEDEAYVSRVGPWINKDEFNLVHDWLFSPTKGDLQLAFDRLVIWKLRRQNLTPATIMSTLAILEVQLKDIKNTCPEGDLRAMYSNAFTKFLNYVSSIVRGRQHTSMYATAKALGIHSFLVDLRHLCAHGQVLPALDMSKRTAGYCMDWLKQFYWDREQSVIRDASVTDVRLKSSLRLEEAVTEMFLLYDAATKAINSGYRSVDDVTEDTLTDEHLQVLQNYAAKIRNNKLSFIANKAINNLASLSNSTGRDRGNDNIYCDVLIGQKYFMKASAKVANSAKVDDFIGLHQNLFRLFAIAGFINTLFERFVMICEDECEKPFLRKAASFWAIQVADGFILFKEFKKVFKRKKEKDTKFDMDTAPVNTDVMTEGIKKIYKEIGIQTKGNKLIFGDTVRRPWDLFFDRHFILERVFNVNEYTLDIIEKCVLLSDPPVSIADMSKIKELLSIYADQNSNSESVDNTADNQIYTVEEHVLGKKVEPDSVESNETKRYGIWEEAPDHIKWKYIPLGSFL